MHTLLTYVIAHNYIIMYALMHTHTHTHTCTMLLVEPLRLLAGPSSVIVEAGSYVVLDCVVDGFPAPTVTWSRDGFPLPSCPSSLAGQTCVVNNSYIYVESSRVEDSGIYTCQADGVSDHLTYTVDITVIPHRSKRQVLMGCVVEDVLHGAGAYGVCGRGCLT